MKKVYTDALHKSYVRTTPIFKWTKSKKRLTHDKI